MWRALRIAALAAITLAGCSLILDADRHQSDVVPVAASEVCARFAEVGCAATRDCCPVTSFDFDQCVVDASAMCADQIGGFALNPRTGYDDVRAGLELAEGRMLAEACDPAYYAWANGRDGAVGVLAGSVPYGESCEPIDAAVIFACADDGHCAFENAMWTCEAPFAQGTDCTFDLECAFDLQCDHELNTCQPLRADGRSCRRNDQCQSALCVGANLLLAGTCTSATVGQAFCGNMP